MSSLKDGLLLNDIINYKIIKIFIAISIKKYCYLTRFKISGAVTFTLLQKYKTQQLKIKFKAFCHDYNKFLTYRVTWK